MRTFWLSKKDRPACILFFAGWGMDPAPFIPVPASACDVLMIYDYRQLSERPAQLLPQGYDQLLLVAWSMGVWAAGSLLASCRERFATAAAINGTLTPVDAQRGIADADFTSVINEFSPDRLDIFHRSMFDDEADYLLFSEHRPKRPAEEVRRELLSLYAAVQNRGPAQDIFSRRLVGSRDRVFAVRNQVRSWGRDNCTMLKMAHFPFYRYPDWETLAGA